MPLEALLETMIPLAKTIAGLQLADPAAAQDQLTRLHPIADLDAVRAQVLAASQAGTLTPRGGESLRYGRVCKATERTFALSIDAVDMTASGPEHTHPKGEVSLCFAIEGAPTFMDQAPGWVVEGPGSRHVPTVAGGRMIILYFLPDGAMIW